MPEKFLRNENDVIVNSLPEEKIKLRLSSAFYDKYIKYKSYIKQGILGNRANIIAINNSTSQYRSLEDNIPRIIKVLFAFGHQILDLKNPRPSNEIRVSRRKSIHKSNGSEIRTDYFTTDEFSEISGVIFSSSDISSVNKSIGYDISLIKNPYAAVPITNEFDNYNFFRIYEWVDDKIVWKNNEV